MMVASLSGLLCLAALAATGADALTVTSKTITQLLALNANSSPPLIPKTAVIMPDDYEDYARSRTPLALFPAGNPPGRRLPAPAPGPDLPAFTADRATSPEVFVDASPLDSVGQKCAPGGDAAGHYFYNVWDPELVPYVVDRGDPGRTDAAMVVAPGGGRIHLAWEAEGIATAEWLNSIGISAFVLKYRVPDPDGQISAMDAQRAMSLVRSRAAEYGFNASRVGWIGGSAGAKLGVDACVVADGRLYPPIDDVDDVSFRADFMILLYGAHHMPRDALKRLPVMALFYTRDDPCIVLDIYQEFAAQVKQGSQKPFLVHEFPDGGHGWGSCDYYPQLKGLEVCSWKAMALEFLEATVLL